MSAVFWKAVPARIANAEAVGSIPSNPFYADS